MTLSGNIAAAGFFLASAYFAAELIKALSNRGQSRDDARATAMKVGMEQGVLDRDDVLDILDDVNIDEDVWD